MATSYTTWAVGLRRWLELGWKATKFYWLQEETGHCCKSSMDELLVVVISWQLVVLLVVEDNVGSGWIMVVALTATATCAATGER